FADAAPGDALTGPIEVPLILKLLKLKTHSCPSGRPRSWSPRHRPHFWPLLTTAPRPGGANRRPTHRNRHWQAFRLKTKPHAVFVFRNGRGSVSVPGLEKH